MCQYLALTPFAFPFINCWRYRATPAGQRTWVEEFDKRTAWYTYDSLGRLKTETVTGSIKDGKNGTVTYGYDNVGNRLSRTSSLLGVTNQSFGYDWNDRLNGDQYDNNGNTKSAPVSQPPGTPEPGVGGSTILGTDDYDSENRLVQRTGANGSNVTLVYDGDGNRVAEIAGGQTKAYLVDDRNPTGYAQVVEEIVNGVVNHTYTYGHDLISQDQFDSTIAAWRASFYGYDGRGTVRFLTDETGAVTDTYTYDAFGTLITASGSTSNRYLYSGEQFDPNLGLYYLRARLMNPLTGRFWSMDSYEGWETDPSSLHKYLYSGADPTNRNDPTGHFSLTELGASTAIANALRIGGIAASLQQGSIVFAQAHALGIGAHLRNAAVEAILQDDWESADGLLLWNDLVAVSVGQAESFNDTVTTAVSAAGMYTLVKAIPRAIAAAPAVGQWVKNLPKLLRSTTALRSGAAEFRAIVPYSGMTASGWPGNGGFLGYVTKTELKVGAVIDRYGSRSGSYASPFGTPFSNRGLPPDYATLPYESYEVLKPVAVESGLAAPAFDLPGLGVQFKLPASIQELIDAGVLRKR